MMPQTWRISARLKQARTQMPGGMSCAELERKVAGAGIGGYARSRVSRLELGYADATWPEIVAIAKILSVVPEWLAGLPMPASISHSHGVETAEAKAPTPPPAARAAPALSTPTGLAAAQRTGTTIAAAEPAPASDALQVPERNGRPDVEYRKCLGAELARAEKELHRTGTPAAEWRRWREYEKALRAQLGQLRP